MNVGLSWAGGVLGSGFGVEGCGGGAAVAFPAKKSRGKAFTFTIH
jgi:hypothetical protein